MVLLKEDENKDNKEKKDELIIDNENEDKKEEDDQILLNISISNKHDDEKYIPEINYINQNPFKSFTKAGLSFTIGGIYGGGIGGILLNPIVFASGLIFSGIGITILIPSLIGLGIYKLYKKYKNEEYKAFLKLLNDGKEMKEEREIMKEISNNMKKEINENFSIDFNLQYNYQIKNEIDKYIQNIIEKKKLKWDSLIELNENKIKNSSSLNVILLGNSGVGKSTLINEILNLKQNKADEQKNYEAMHIKGWIKKYPIKEEDTNLKKIYLWDTEGIEYSKENTNDQSNHLKKVFEKINAQKSIPNEQINCIWFCINGKTLQPSEIKYIEELLKVYNPNCIIPIIFIYTQAYEFENIYIEGFKEKLKGIKYFKENENKFHYIDLISKEYIYSFRGEKISEKPKNLKKLLKETLDISKDGMRVVVNDIINRICFDLNTKAKKFETKIYNKKINLFNNVLNIQKKEIIEIFEITKPNLKYMIKYYFNDIDKSLINDLDKSINNIIFILEQIIKGKINYLIKNSSYEYLCKSYENFIISKYKIKEEPKKPLNEFKKDINEFILKPIYYGKKNYSIIEIYEIITNTILEDLLEKYNTHLDYTKNKMKDSMIRILEENFNNFFENSNINEYINN